MISRDVTYCADSLAGRCVNRECRRFLTTSMVDAARRAAAMLSIADFFAECPTRKEPTL